MGQPVAVAVEEVRRARHFAAEAEFVARALLERAAAAAADEGLSVRQFAQSVGISKSHAARAMKRNSTHVGYAINPADQEAIDAALAYVRRQPHVPGGQPKII